MLNLVRDERKQDELSPQQPEDFSALFEFFDFTRDRIKHLIILGTSFTIFSELSADVGQKRVISFGKIRTPIKIKLALPPPPLLEKKSQHPPPQKEEFYGHGGFQQKEPKNARRP